GGPGRRAGRGRSRAGPRALQPTGPRPPFRGPLPPALSEFALIEIASWGELWAGADGGRAAMPSGTRRRRAGRARRVALRKGSGHALAAARLHVPRRPPAVPEPAGLGRD